MLSEEVYSGAQVGVTGVESVLAEALLVFSFYSQHPVCFSQHYSFYPPNNFILNYSLFSKRCIQMSENGNFASH